jgi:hypothetical protein
MALEILKESNEAHRRFNDKLNAIEQQFRDHHKGIWEKIYTDLGLDPDGDYDFNVITGQVFENVPKEGLDK